MGQPARVQVDAVPERSYQGRLRQIIPMGDRSRAIIQVKVEVMDADERLFPEMSATVHFLPDETAVAAAAEERPRVFVPAAAVRRRDGGHIVWTVRDERATAVTVVAGAELDGQVEIREGLSGGETVVLDPPSGLADGDRVRIAE